METLGVRQLFSYRKAPALPAKTPLVTRRREKPTSVIYRRVEVEQTRAMGFNRNSDYAEVPGTRVRARLSLV